MPIRFEYTVNPSFPRKNVTPYLDTGRESIGYASDNAASLHPIGITLQARRDWWPLTTSELSYTPSA